MDISSDQEEFLRAARLLPPGLRCELLTLPESVRSGAEELRLRVGRAPSIVIRGDELSVLPEHVVSNAELQMVLEIATRASVHTYADNIRAGFVTAAGGCRVGLCGTVTTEEGCITAMRRLSSVCIRIPREKRGCADGIFPALTDGGFSSTLLLSPPGGGKTTLLRELVRLLSDGGQRVALADERSEVAGDFAGMPCFDVGERTDVLTGAPKSEGVYLLLRSMAPQILAFDEITAPSDIEAASEAANCGVKLLATAHAAGVEDLCERPMYRKLLERKLFARAVIIENEGGSRRYRVEALQ
ncbi:MAG: stage III sporulation protein AB [Oscillospiraceae bacterium]|jgi:stage III sporulation protein AA